MTDDDDTMSTTELVACLQVSRNQLWRWVAQHILVPAGGRGSGNDLCWDPAETAAAMAVSRAWKTGITSPATLRWVGDLAAAAVPGRYDQDGLTVIVNPDHADDLGFPFDRPTLIVETRTSPHDLASARDGTSRPHRLSDRDRH